MSIVNGTMTMFPPPTDYVVDFTNPQRTLTTETYTIFIIENILAIAFLAQRLFTKICVMKQFQIDDGTTPSNHQPQRQRLLRQSPLCLLGCSP